MSDFDFHMCGKDLYMFDFIQWMCVSVRLSVCCLQTIYRQCEQDHKEQTSVPALVSPLSNRTIVNTTAAPTKRFECCACVCDFRVKVETSAVSFLEICWWLTQYVLCDLDMKAFQVINDLFTQRVRAEDRAGFEATPSYWTWVNVLWNSGGFS